MKKNVLILVAVMVMISAFAFRAQNNNGLANVQKIRGKYVFVLCEPVNDYEVVGEVNSALSMIAGVKEFKKKLTEIMDKALVKEKKGKVPDFDGIITEDAEYGTLIKFKK